MTTDEALDELAHATATAVRGVLETFVQDDVSHDAVDVVPDGRSPFDDVPLPAIGLSLPFVDGARGGTVLVISQLGARRLAARMMKEDPPDNAEEDLTELEMSAVAEASNQMMAAAAGAISSVLGQEVELSVPETRYLRSQDEARGAYPPAEHAAVVQFTVCGEQARLIQLVPAGFVALLTGALDEQTEEDVDLPSADGEDGVQSDAILGVPVRLWAELGRFRMELGRAVSLPPGAVVELREAVEEPVDLIVNGTLFGRGELLVAPDGSWAVRVAELVGVTSDANNGGEIR